MQKRPNNITKNEINEDLMINQNKPTEDTHETPKNEIIESIDDISDTIKRVGGRLFKATTKEYGNLLSTGVDKIIKKLKTKL